MSGSKISIVLAATALLVSVLFATPLGQAAGNLVLGKNSVGSKQVIDGSLRTRDLNKKTVAALHGAQGPRGPQGIQGAQGIQGVQGVQGIQGIQGTARAYGAVAADGTLSRSKNVVAVTKPKFNVYCIALAAGIDASKTGLVATPDFTDDSTHFLANGSQTIVEWVSDASYCPAGQLEVLTGDRHISTVGSADGDVHTVYNGYNEEPFFFVVP